MRLALASVLLMFVSLGCGPSDRTPGGPGSIDAPPEGLPPLPPDACMGIGCQVVNCESQGRPNTTISGMVHAPNGTLPLYGVTVYIPYSEPGALPDGVQCSACTEELPGQAVTKTQTNELGRFTLENVPSGTDIPLIVTIGKWRRRLVVPTVTECADNPVDPALTRLPKNKTEGDIPKIAIATGGCDALECLIRKLGVEETEFTADSGNGRVHMYVSNGASTTVGNAPLASVTTLWSNLTKLKQYDIGLFSCECSENPGNKPLESMNNMKAYADAGGRLFLSHYHHVWITGASATQAPPVWPSIAQCPSDGSSAGNVLIDTVSNPKGPSFSLWMQYVMGSPSPGVIPIQEGRQSCTSIDPMKAERWVYLPGATQYPQNFQFTTPNEMPAANRCGKVVFSDMHVASGSSSSSPFPSGCSASPMTPQEKALAFMFFDIASCVGVIQ